MKRTIQKMSDGTTRIKDAGKKLIKSGKFKAQVPQDFSWKIEERTSSSGETAYAVEMTNNSIRQSSTLGNFKTEEEALRNLKAYVKSHLKANI